MRVQWIAVVVGALLTSACGLENQAQPSLIGPADLGLSITMTASPDQLPRDGSSQSVITLSARNPQNQPIAGERLSLSLAGAPAGAAISQSEVTTNSQGTATFTVTAPSQGSTGNSIVVVATPVGTNADNARARVLSIIVNPANAAAPTAAFTVSPTTPEIGQLVTFDASTTTDEGVACTSCAFTWDFGSDGISTGRIVTHTFTSAGSFIVRLTAVDSTGSASRVAQQTVVVTGTTIPIGLAVTSSPATPIAKQAATFTATATAATNHRIVSYQFVWGDGDTNNTNSPVIQHTYAQAGQYLLTLTVRDDLGQSSTANVVITVASGLTVSISGQTPPNPTNGQTVTFTATATSNVASSITKYEWDLDGDGSYETDTGTTPTASRAYASGTTIVGLKVTDSRGVTQTATRTVTVP